MASAHILYAWFYLIEYYNETLVTGNTLIMIIGIHFHQFSFTKKKFNNGERNDNDTQWILNMNCLTTIILHTNTMYCCGWFYYCNEHWTRYENDVDMQCMKLKKQLRLTVAKSIDILSNLLNIHVLNILTLMI